MNKKVLISGYGSIGRRHTKILSKVVKNKNITILSKQKISKFFNIKNIKMLNEIDPDYIVICNPTADHLSKIKFIEKNCKNKIVLVEKPLFSKPNGIKIKNNKYYVGYNLRFNSLINFLKNKIKSKKIWNVNIFCGSYLPKWRNNIDYRKSASAKKKFGGGALLDLSHELDYIQWLFGKIKIEYCKSKKLSNLKIETDDFLSLVCKTKKVPSIQLILNYFTRNPTRQIFIDGNNISLQADLIKKKIVCFENNKKRIYNFNNSNKNLEIKKQHLAALTKKKAHNLCTYNEGNQILYLIEQIRTRSKI
jgi:CMP-N,N'-diacetyllegionaminic acid synthase|tara:strand:+ start:11174 stop:12091 length:918 start_codon:yes stop_codon:yes gene_type:complete